MPTTAVQNFIQTELQQALMPTFLEISDESYQHRGHAGYNAAGSHFAVTIASAAFKNKTLLECHRLIYAALGTTIGQAIHALRITVLR